ncbi:hypothetical protein BP5796_08358 [Coleophoma crateriformis]|uniref:Uncharacterized protein n=1 Tax=Coleophoma crateriformis TaxID=565419 RepID=A0A3D8R7N7_9HELO|nr:hypothetical protein BP5796_08358 [Coleophoma crateriformis]
MASTTTTTRLLIQTHHMTSKAKIRSLTLSAAKHRLSVVLKTGKPPGIMLAEGPAASVQQWMGHVRRLRYKDYRLMKTEEVSCPEGKGLAGIVEPGKVLEIDELKAFARFLGDSHDDGNLVNWWRRGMGFVGEDK